MTKNTYYLPLLFLLLFLSGKGMAQQKVYIHSIDMNGVNHSTQISYTQLLQSYVNNQNIYDAVLSNSDTLFGVNEIQKVQKRAQELHCNYFLCININSQIDVNLISAKLYQTENPDRFFWNTTQRYSKIKHLPGVLEHIAKHMGNQKDHAIYDPLAGEQEFSDPFLTTLFTIGGSSLFTHMKSFASGLGIGLTYEKKNAIYELKSEFYASQNYSFVNANLGIWKPFSTKKNTFYAGGGLAFSTSKLISFVDKNYMGYIYPQKERANNFGLSIIAGGGYYIDRFSDMGLRLGAKVFVNAYQLNHLTPVGFTFDLGIFIRGNR